ncbi:cold shock domain-containing protein [Shewanella sp. GXUN23E]|uniref:cold shock domain-containing protein n=1 Tax=Shewanella sp. GXUN23E TaxID=3422498 RepID=UPI003D7CA14D
MYSDEIRYQGTLKYWYPEKGYGYISPRDGSQDVFIYYSQLSHMSRPPQLGDIIAFELDDMGFRPRAIKAEILGVSPTTFAFDRHYFRTWLTVDGLLRLSLVLVAVLAMFMVIERWQPAPHTSFTSFYSGRVICFDTARIQNRCSDNAEYEQIKGGDCQSAVDIPHRPSC